MVVSSITSMYLYGSHTTDTYYCICSSGDGRCLGSDDAGNQDVTQWFSFLIIIVLSTLNMKQNT